MYAAPMCWLLLIISLSWGYCDEVIIGMNKRIPKWLRNNSRDNENPSLMTNQGNGCIACETSSKSQWRFPSEKPTTSAAPRSASPETPSSSSSSLSDRHITMMVDILKSLEKHPYPVNTEEQSAKLSVDLYNGKETLVYKLSPGAIYSGVRNTENTHSSPPNTKQQNQFSFEGLGQDNKITGIRRDSPIDPGNSFHQFREDSLQSKNIQNPFLRPSVKWKVHYVQPKPPLSSMDNPYWPSRAKHQDRSKSSQRIKIKSSPLPPPPYGSDILLYPLAKAIHIARAKARGAWLSFLLLHYLGFLPPIPGIPRHTDPFDVMTTAMNMFGKST